MDDEESNAAQSGDDCACGGECSGNCGGGGCEPSMAEKAWMMAHVAKKQLLHEKIRERVEKLHGKKLDALAEAIVEFAKESEASEAEQDKRAEKIAEQMAEVFG